MLTLKASERSMCPSLQVFHHAKGLIPVTTCQETYGAALSGFASQASSVGLQLLQEQELLSLEAALLTMFWKRLQMVQQRVVGCTCRDGHLTQLSLAGLGLSCPFPATRITALTYLETLDLSSNSITGK